MASLDSDAHHHAKEQVILIHKRFQTLFAVALMLVALRIPALSATVETTTQIQVSLFDSYVELVRRESMLEPSTETLVKGLQMGLRGYLASKGATLAPVPGNTVEDFKREFTQSVRANPRIDERQAFYASLKGMLEPLNERYTRFLTPDEYRHLQARVEGSDESGLGLRVELDTLAEKQLTIAEIFESTPAAGAGLVAGDRIVRIDGTGTQGLSLSQAKELLAGPVGAPVRLSLTRSGQNLDVTLTRADVRTPTVTFEKLTNQVGYIRLHAFSQNAAQELDAALAALSAQGVTAYVLDLRDNRGGYVSTAIDVVSRFVPASSKVMSLVQRRKTPITYTTYATRYQPRPMVVLVNERTASASEIVAGCLQDLGAATIMGNRSFGKALVQKVVPLPDGSAFTISTGKYLTPKGRDLHKNGVTPDVALDPCSFSSVSADRNIQKALAAIEARLSAADTTRQP